MKISSVFFVHFIFFCHFSGVLSSNPESMVVQSPEDNEERFAEILEIQMESNQRRMKMSQNLERPRRPIVRIMRPFVVGSRIYWREVSRENLDRVRDYNRFPNNWESFRTNQPISRRPTVKSAIDVNNRRTQDSETSQVPQNNVPNNNFRRNSLSPAPVTPEGRETISENNNNNQEHVTKATKKVSADSNLFSGIVNDFAFKLIEKLNLESNFVISPLSIFIALSMCYLGADGRAKSQMEQVMGMNDNAVHGNLLHQGIKDLMSLVLEETSGYQLFVANGMFLGNNLTPDAQFVENIKKYYDAELKQVDFADAQSSLRTINNWVAESTRNTITDILNSPAPPLTRLILLNAIFFKGTWKMQFPRNLTYNGKFHSLDGTEKEVALMSLFDEKFPLFRSEEHRQTFIKLPYDGDEVSMFIALPFTAREKPLSSVSDQMLCHVRDALVDTKIDSVAIPKFKLEYSNSLGRPLQQLGITDIFDRNVVDLRKLRKENDVYVSNIMHKAVVEVNEEGTTASGSTSITFVPLSSRNTRNFVADHPFSFYIVHEPSGLVLFYGKIFDFNSQSNAANNRRENVRVRTRPNSEGRG